MNARDWTQFLQKGHGKEIPIAQLSAAMVTHLGASSDKVYYHHDYVVKAVKKHGLKATDFEFIFDVVEFGRALADKPRHILFMYFTTAGWFQASVKRAEASGRLYIATYYKTNLKEVVRKTKKHKVLRKDKWTA